MNLRLFLLSLLPILRRWSPHLRRWSNNRLVAASLCVCGLALLALAVHLGSQSERSAEKMTFFRIATGPASGTYFSVGKTLASVISHPTGAEACEVGGRCGVPGLIAIAQTTEGSSSK